MTRLACIDLCPGGVSTKGALGLEEVLIVDGIGRPLVGQLQRNYMLTILFPLITTWHIFIHERRSGL